MYISVKKCFDLDEIVKSFEVALRSFISATMITKYTTVNDFEAALKHLESKFESCAVIFSTKNQAKIKKLLSNTQDRYQIIVDCYESHKNNDYDNDVPYVSELVDYISLFFNDCFINQDILKNFESIEKFYFNCTEYLLVRNTLSHPASTKVLTTEAVSVLGFVRKFSQNIDDKYFWFVDKPSILKKIRAFHLNSTPMIKKENLNEIALLHKRVVCRGEEFNTLSEYLFGKSSHYRVAGSVVLFGYGGVGKTALVVDFLYRLLSQLKDDSKYNYDFILFYTSKDEYLKQDLTTGSLYIDKYKAQIDSFESFKAFLYRDLEIESIDDIPTNYRSGIIVIDNVENLDEIEKRKIFEFIKQTPREIQYIVTSRNEEPCEEKLHIKEFRSLEKGSAFIREFTSSEGLDIELQEDETQSLVNASKGNALILVQCLTGLNEGSMGFEEVIANLENYKSKSVEIIADFMYKNTFERAISDLENDGYEPKTIIRIISLYGEKIDLYSISKLSKKDLATSETVCSYLAKKLILNKIGEYYTVNEFANSFIFIKLLPSSYETQTLLFRIRDHKTKMGETLESLDEKCCGNDKIRSIMEDWKPRNYIDRIVIAEAFDTFGKIHAPIKRRDLTTINRILEEYDQIELVTNHPYIQFQKARICGKCLRLFGNEEHKNMIGTICRCYEDSIESILFSYPAIRGTNSHGAVLMFYGIFLGTVLKDNSRSIKYLEEAVDTFQIDSGKNYFSALYYLTISCSFKCKESQDPAFKHKLQRTIKKVLENKDDAVKTGFNVNKYEKEFASYI